MNANAQQPTVRNVALRKIDLTLLHQANPFLATHSVVIEKACDAFLNGTAYTNLQPKAWASVPGCPRGLAKAKRGRRTAPMAWLQAKLQLKCVQKLELVATLLMLRYRLYGKARCSYALAVAWLARDSRLPQI